MNRTRLSIALPCQSFDDFPVRLSAEKSANLLKCWTALWHPSLLASSRLRPDIWSVEPDEAADASSDETAAVVVPMIAGKEFDRAADAFESIKAIRCDTSNISREDIVSLVKEMLAIGAALSSGDQDADVLIDLAEDFFALGYAWLQVRLMTLHVRYSTNLDDDAFDGALIEAATAWGRGEQKSASEKLTRCFDLLLEEKNNYYSVTPDLLDLVLVEPGTIDAKLESQLSMDHHINLLLTGNAAERFSVEMPAAFQVVKQRLSDGSLSIIGGLQRELSDSLIPFESQLRQFHAGSQTFESLLDTRLRTFARRRFGLTSMTPGLLEQLDYSGACHMTFDGGTLPDVHGSNMRWVGEDAQTVPALATVPLDANDSRGFLSLGIQIAKQVDSEHTATIVLAHWPNRFCDSFSDLIRLKKYGSLFGDFVGFDDYFEAAYDPGYGEPFTAEQYESPGLARDLQQGATDPISRFVKYWELHQHLVGCRSLLAMVAFAGERDEAEIVKTLSEWTSKIASFEDSIDAMIDGAGICSDSKQKANETKQAIDDLRLEILERFFQGPDIVSDEAAAICVINTASFSRAAFLSGGAVLEIPAMGWVTVSPDRDARLKRSLGGPPVDDGLTLRNEFIQVSVDPKSGGIRSLQTYDQRQTQASQRLSVRIPTDKHSATYADMVADKISTERVSPTESRIISQGHLNDPSTEESLGRFTQTLSLRRKDPFADLQIELHDLSELPIDSNHYVCSRLAWHDETAPVFYGSSELRSRSTNAWIEAPTYVRVEQPDHSVTLLTHGLPWHRRSARNRLDSIMVVGNESKRKFRMSLGPDSANDLAAAIGRGLPPAQISLAQHSSMNDGWLFHFSSRNIVGLFCEPIMNDDCIQGVRWRLLETQGRRGKLKITCPFEVAGAERMMFDGRGAGSLVFDGRVVEIDFTRNEYFEVHIFCAT